MNFCRAGEPTEQGTYGAGEPTEQGTYGSLNRPSGAVGDPG